MFVNLKSLKSFVKIYPLITLSIFFLVIIIHSNFSYLYHSQFSFLAQSFLHGKTYFLEQPGSWLDTVFFKGQYYWPLGPFPALFLTPLLLIFGNTGLPLYQGLLQIILIFLIILICFKIARYFKYSIIDSYYFSFAFCFSTMFFGIALFPSSWFFSHVVVSFLMFLFLIFFIYKKDYLWLGLIAGMIIGTRLTAGLTIILFVVLEILFLANGKIIKKFVRFFLPVFVCGMLLLVYNQIRFGNFLEFGYSLQSLFYEPLVRARSYGLNSLQHIPGNLYYSLLSVPAPVYKEGIPPVLSFPYVKPSPWGVSIFITSPYLIYMFFLSYRDRLSKIMLVSITFCAFMILTYYGVGYFQYGYRYFLDFWPLLFFLLMRNYQLKYKQLSNAFKITILASSMINFYLILVLNEVIK